MKKNILFGNQYATQLFVRLTFLVFFLLPLSLVFAQEEAVPQPPESGYVDPLIDFNTLGKNDAQTDYLQNENWLARLNSSSDYIANRRLTYTKNVQNTKGNNYLGVRVNFPEIDANSYVEVTPFLPVSFLPLDGKEIKGRGALGNVGNIKKLLVKVAGRNFPHELSITLEDNNGVKSKYRMGALKFYGWKTMEWNNPRYLEDVRQRDLLLTDLQVLYPRILPAVRLNSIVILRQQGNLTGNFITYFDNISLVYDKAFEETTQEEKDADDYIDDDSIWKINSDDMEAEAKLLQEKLENYRFLEEREKLRMNLREVGGVPTPAAPQEQ